jgi:nucleoside-diphosphate-sugar epimerase
VRWVTGALGDVDSLRRLVSGAGTVFHLAGVLRAGYEREFDVGNRQGTANLVSAVRADADSARLVQVSSLAAVGPSSEPGGLGPEAEPAPISGYGRSKLGAEMELRQDTGWWTIVRPPAIYGPRDTDVLEFFRMANRGVVALPAGERWLTVAWVGDVVRATVAAAAGEAGRLYHLGEAEPVRLDRLIEALCDAGDVGARVVQLPHALVMGAGAVGSALQRLGWRRFALTLDKSRELLARHWTARTADSLHALGLGETTPWEQGAKITWSWYRERGWLT